jgi:hypothetical protein
MFNDPLSIILIIGASLCIILDICAVVYLCKLYRNEFKDD